MKLGRLQLMERGSVGSIPLADCGTLLPGVVVSIVEPETELACTPREMGEVWVHSDAAPVGLAAPEADVAVAATAEILQCHIGNNGDSLVYCRTGLQGFIHVRRKSSKMYRKCLLLFK